jgi:hypothetical protein
LEKPINTDDFRLSEESDSEKLNIKPEDINNSDNESDISDFYIENLFEETNNMAVTLNEMRRLFEQVNGLPNGALNNALAPGVNITARIDNIRNELGGVIRMPIFNGKEDEDVGDWIR